MRRDTDALRRAVEVRRARELARLRRDEESARAARRARARRDEALETMRRDLVLIARTADPQMRAWLAERLELVLRAFPGGRERAIELPALDFSDEPPRFVHEGGAGRSARSWKRYTVSIGSTLRFRWSAGAIGGAGGRELPIRPRSWEALAQLDLRRALEQAEWQEPDVLEVALVVASRIARGELDELVLARLRVR